MNLSALGTHFKSVKKERRVIIAPAGDSFLATEHQIVARLTREQLPRVFSRRDIWPEIPELGGEAMVYWTSDDEELDPTERNMGECQPEEGEKVAAKWQEWTNLLLLQPLTFTPWIQLFEKGLMAHLLRIPGGDYLYLDYDLVALFSSTPAKLRWYGTGPTSPVVLATQENELLGLIAPLDRSNLETLTPPAEEQEIEPRRGRPRKKETEGELPAVCNCVKCGAELGFGAGQENAVHMIDDRPHCSKCAEAIERQGIPWVIDIVDTKTGEVKMLELKFANRKLAERYIRGTEGIRPGKELRARQATEEEEKSKWAWVTKISRAGKVEKTCETCGSELEECHAPEDGSVCPNWTLRGGLGADETD